MALFDWIAVTVIGLSILIGLWRGLVFEVISLVGWVAAFLCAQWFAADVGAWLPFGAPGAPWRYAAGFILMFVLVAFTVGLAATAMRKLMKVTGLRPVDRTLGAVFGAVRALVVLLVVAMMVHLLSLGQSAWWRESAGAPWLNSALQRLKPALPEQLSGYLP